MQEQIREERAPKSKEDRVKIPVWRLEDLRAESFDSRWA
jgi:hypothetical protein